MGHRALRSPGRPRPFRLAQNKKIIRRGGIYPARRRLRRRRVPGTMRASSPTEVCYNVGMSFPGWPRAPVRFVGEGHGPPAEPCAAANRADISGLRAGPAVFGLRNAPAGAVESAPTRVAGSRGLRLPGVPARKKMKKFLIPHSLPVPNFKSTPSSTAPCRSRRRRRRR